MTKRTYRRTPYESAEWEELRAAGYRTVAINGEGIALMVLEVER